MNKIIIDFITNAYEEVSRNNINVQQKFANLTKLIGIVLVNWYEGIEADKNWIAEYKYLNKQDNYKV